MAGMKHDADKQRWHSLPLREQFKAEYPEMWEGE